MFFEKWGNKLFNLLHWRVAEGDETEAGVVEIPRFAYNDVFVINWKLAWNVFFNSLGFKPQAIENEGWKQITKRHNLFLGAL